MMAAAGARCSSIHHLRRTERVISFDPGGFVIIDKPLLGFWFQVASVKLFGFRGTRLLLPEALAGVLSVLVLYWLVARSFGRVAGLIAALALAITPISVLTARNNKRAHPTSSYNRTEQTQ
jgi:4-amino-4-deoxy-L-arabinose transferase-like glycosyltransferase